MATTSIGSGGVTFPDGTTQASKASPGNVVTTLYTSPAPWTKPADLKAVRVTLLGGGGGGGGYRGGPASFPGSVGGGGGAGGFGGAQAPTIPSPLTITVGAGGAGGPAPGTVASRTAGSPGGTSSFGALISATGGAGGGPAGGASGTFTSTPQGVGFQGESTTNPAGGDAFQNWGFGGSGGGTGSTGTGYGSGGGGVSGPDPTATPYAGGAGKAGFVLVEEFY